MTQDTAHRIRQVWDELESQLPDKSTEFLLEVTAQECGQKHPKLTLFAGDVAEALTITNYFAGRQQP